MDRPRTRWIRSLGIVAAGATGTFVALGVPANAGATTDGTVTVAWGGLSERTGPGTWAPRTGVLPNGTGLMISCQVPGESVSGNVRTTDRWDRLSNGRYVSDAFVSRPRPVEPCPTGTSGTTNRGTAAGPVSDTAGVPAGRWVAPVPHRGQPGFRTAGRPTHEGVDLIAPRNTPIRAAAAGTVVTVECNTSGTTCDVDGGTRVRGCGWYLEIRHANNVVTRYCHMVRRPTVSEGAAVSAGQIVGHVGTSGNSSGPHLHFEVHLGYPAGSGNAVDPIGFMRRVGAPIG